MNSSLAGISFEESSLDGMLLYRVLQETKNPKVKEALAVAAKRIEEGKPFDPKQLIPERVASLIREMNGENEKNPGSMTVDDFCQKLGLEPSPPKAGEMTSDDFIKKVLG